MPLRLLVVEDSARDTELLILHLQRSGVDVCYRRVDTAATLAAALDSQEWDVIISGYNMPHFSGLAALKLIAQRGFDGPFIIVSGAIGEDEAVAALKAGAHDYLLKDNLSRLVPTIERELRDAKERRQQRETDALYRTLIEILPDSITVADLTGTVLIRNIQAAELHGYSSPEEMKDLDAFDLVADQDRQRLLECAQQLQTSGTSTRSDECLCLRRDGNVFPAAVSLSVIRSDAGGASGLISVMRDITERKQAEETLAYLALHDSLTGLPNRILLQDRLSQAIAASERSRTPLAVLLLDLDRFKEINDAFGHAGGDALLQQLGPRLQQAIRASGTVARSQGPGHTVARLGGDEFAVVLPGANESAGLAVGRRVLTILEEPFFIEGQSLDIGVFVGIALYPKHGSTGEALLRHADVAMYQAKQRGDRHAVYEDALGRHSQRRLTLMNELRRALEADQLSLHYQPKVTVAGGRLVAAEALLRWRHPDYGLILPDEFIPLAEQTGMMKPLTRWVLTEAVRQCGVWHDSAIDISVQVNVSARALHDQELAEMAGTVLRTSSAPPEWLVVEITEGALMIDPDRALDVLRHMADMGICISVDDFGTGYSSLQYLDDLPASELKIDRSFVRDIDQNHSHYRIVQSTINLGHELGLEIVAEGVENRQAWDLLRTMECDTLQGYYVSCPLAPDSFMDWAARHCAGRSSPCHVVPE